MIIGVPKEVKDSEFRVGMVPACVEQLSKAGHRVLVEQSAGVGSGVSDEQYRQAGAEIVSSHEEAISSVEMIVKVKEPLPCEYELFREGQVVFTYFHFAADKGLTEAMLARKVVAVAYETVETPGGQLPLLIPMSEVAGRMAAQEGAKFLEKPMMGKGILLGGVPGVAPAKVLIIGGGVVGTNSAKLAAGLGAEVTIMDTNLDRLRYLDDIMPKNVTTLMSNAHNMRQQLTQADLVIGAVLIPGAQAPRLITRAMLKLMAPGSVIVDVAVDQGGCIETTHPTTHKDPVYVVDDIVHYCVANMPGAVAGTSTYALTNATSPYVLELAEKGYRQSAADSSAIAKGINMINGELVCSGVAQAFGMKSQHLQEVLN